MAGLLQAAAEIESLDGDSSGDGGGTKPCETKAAPTTSGVGGGSGSEGGRVGVVVVVARKRVAIDVFLSALTEEVAAICEDIDVDAMVSA